MATSKTTPTFGIASFLTFLGGLVLAAALVLPLFDTHSGFQQAIAASAAHAVHLAKSSASDPDRDDKATQLADARLAIADIAYHGDANHPLKLQEPVRDLAAKFGFELKSELVVLPKPAEDLAATASRAAANPTVWNLWHVANQVRRYDSYFRPESVAKSRVLVILLGAIPFFALICLATPLLQAFGVPNPLFQAITFAATLCLVLVFVYLMPTPLDAAGERPFAMYVPGETYSLGFFALMVAAALLFAGTLTGFSGLWWLALLLDVLVLIGGGALVTLVGGGFSPAPKVTPRSAPPATNSSTPINANTNSAEHDNRK